MSKPDHMKPPGRPMTRRNADHRLLATSTDQLLTKSTRDQDIENLERALSIRPLKPPRRRAP